MSGTDIGSRRGSSSAEDRDDLIRSLVVERFTPWSGHAAGSESVARPALPNGFPFEPIRPIVRPRKYRRGTVPKESSR